MQQTEDKLSGKSNEEFVQFGQRGGELYNQAHDKTCETTTKMFYKRYLK